MNKQPRSDSHLHTRAWAMAWFIACVMLVCGAGPARATNLVYCVRADAAGDQTGADWHHAFTSLPVNLVRGATYYVADGSYPGRVFRDAEQGTNVIAIVKATPAAHGPADGWVDGYGDGVAEFRVDLDAGNGYWAGLVFLRSFYRLDGVTGGGPDAWATNHGFRISSPEKTSILLMLSDKWSKWGLRPNVHSISIASVEFTGQRLPGYGIAVQANASATTVTNVHLRRCHAHDIGGTFVDVRANPGGWLIEACFFARNATSPEHHGVGLRFDNLAGSLVFRNNRMADIVGTGWIGHYTGAAQHGDGAEFYGNVFYCSPGVTNMTGWAPIFSDSNAGVPVVDNWKIYNNTFCNLPYRGTLVQLDTTNSTQIEARNNLGYALGGPLGFVNVDLRVSNVVASVDPFVNWTAGDFRLKAALPSAVLASGAWRTDAYGATRGADGTTDAGAYEFKDTIAPPAAPGRPKVRR